ncbi:hypothetical protein ACQY0O_002368 [Thecaphora frezii]
MFILYDLPGNAAKDIAWSPNTWKVRFILNLKQIPYRTVWVEYPDTKLLYQHVGLESHELSKEGKPLYGLPVIYDSRQDKYVSDSFRIALYLDELYATPASEPQVTLFPPGTAGLQKMFIDLWIQQVSDPLHIITSAYAAAQLPPRSREYYNERRGKRYCVALEALAPPGSEMRRTTWAKVKEALARFHGWMRLNDVAGNHVVFAEVCVASYLTWFKRLLGSESDEWKELVEMNEGRWRGIAQRMEKYEWVDAQALREPIWKPTLPAMAAGHAPVDCATDVAQSERVERVNT